ncbi:hypothetical protein AHiyo8_46920 [Arthrobacter sp. Hiyo8]|nr:hypothetical protein AHiyo8_46920 [Arthrobacter sp. Hiyo8]
MKDDASTQVRSVEEGDAGAMSVFASREAAEEFAASDPFVIHGLVGK